METSLLICPSYYVIGISLMKVLNYIALYVLFTQNVGF